MQRTVVYRLRNTSQRRKLLNLNDLNHKMRFCRGNRSRTYQRKSSYFLISLICITAPQRHYIIIKTLRL